MFSANEIPTVVDTHKAKKPKNLMRLCSPFM